MKTITLFTTLLLACAILLVSCSSYQPEAKRYRVEKAFLDAEKAVTNYGVKPELRSTQDYLNLVSGYQKAYSLFETLFPNLESKSSLSTTEQEAAFLAGKALVVAANLMVTGGQPDSAVATLNQIIETKYFSPQHQSEALLLLGRTSERQGNWVDAEAAYAKLLDLFYPPVVDKMFPAMDVMTLPKAIVEHYQSIGDTAIALQKADWAISYYQKIVSSYPHSPLTMAATRLLAEAYNFKGDFQKSISLLETVKDSTGNIVDAAKGMIADLYFGRLDRKDEAVQMYQDIVSSAGDSSVIASSLMKLATIEFKDKRYDSGREYLRKLTDAFPQSTLLQIGAQQMLAQSFEDQGEYDRAKQEYLNLINGYPNTPQSLQIMMYLPDFFKKIGQPVLAAQWVSKAEEKLKDLAKNSGDKRLMLMASSYLATFYSHNKMYDQAITQFLELRGQFPKSAQAADALLRVGMIYQFSKKDKVRALEAYKEFVKQYPASVVRRTIEQEIRKLEQG
ncbi:MAG: tetratricopeptide repeat protein [candidate division Zixibacteria bacterium]|jgi:tetratricopeptide (TPR) repeat protein|nr:tetratricopeptide repeat protein [candidate division Zixibacteria bacterium]